MTQHRNVQEFSQIAYVTDAPVRTRVDRTFGLPAGLYAVTVAGYLGFAVVMTAVFMNATLAVPMVIIVGTIVAGFGVPALWTRMNPANASRALSWDQFAHRGIETHTGLLSAREAAVQVVILPVLIFVWGIIIAIISAAI